MALLAYISRSCNCRTLPKIVVLVILSILFINAVMNARSKTSSRKRRDVKQYVNIDTSGVKAFLNLQPEDVDPKNPCKILDERSKGKVGSDTIKSKPKPKAHKQNTRVFQPVVTTSTPEPDDIDFVTQEMLNFTINPRKACRDVNTLIYIHSAPDNIERRRTIRRTWGQRGIMKSMAAKILFVMGETNDPDVNIQLQKEVDNFQNIIQASFVDSYRNMTIKAIAAIKWISMYCRNVPNIIKLDDDVVVNVFNLTSYIKNATRVSNRNVIYCNVWAAAKVIRSTDHKHFVRNRDFSSGTYPPYCAGAAVFFSGDVIPKLYNATIGEPYFWVDDLFLTGILTNKTGLRLTDTSTEYKFEGTLLNSFKRNEEFQAVFTHTESIKEMYILWSFLKLRHSHDLMKSFYRLSLPSDKQKSEIVKRISNLS